MLQYSRYCLSPLNVNVSLLSEHKLHISHNQLMYSTGALCAVMIGQIISSTVVERSHDHGEQVVIRLYLDSVEGLVSC